MAFNPESFGYETDKDGNVNFKILYTNYVLEDYEESYRAFVAGVIGFAEPGIMPIYRPGEPPQGWDDETP